MVAAASSNDLAVVVFVVGLTYLLRHFLVFAFWFLGSAFAIFGGLLMVVALSEGTGLREALTILGGGLTFRFVGGLFRRRPALAAE